MEKVEFPLGWTKVQYSSRCKSLLLLSRYTFYSFISIADVLSQRKTSRRSWLWWSYIMPAYFSASDDSADYQLVLVRSTPHLECPTVAWLILRLCCQNNNFGVDGTVFLLTLQSKTSEAYATFRGRAGRDCLSAKYFDCTLQTCFVSTSWMKCLFSGCTCLIWSQTPQPNVTLKLLILDYSFFPPLLSE